MSWFALALISITSISVSTLLQRVLMKSKDSNPIASAIIFQFLLTIYVFLFAKTLGKFTLPPSDVSYPRLFLSGILWAGTTYFSFRAMKLLGAGETTIIVSGNAIISIFLGVVFLKEILTLPIFIGFIFILGAILIIYSDHLSFQSKNGVVFSLLTALFSGTAVVNDAFILKTYEAFSFTAIMSLLPGIILILAFPKEIRNAFGFLKKKEFRLILILTFFYSIQAVSYYLSYQSGAAISTLATLTKASIVLTVILAAIFLKERSNLPKKALAALMVTIGAILLA